MIESKRWTGRTSAILLAAILIAMGAASPSLAQDVQVSLQASETVVQVGDSVDVQINVKGTGMRTPNVEMDDSPNFVEEGRSQGSSISIINGATQVSQNVTLSFRAVKAGRAKIGPARVTVRGRVYQSNAAEIEVADQAKAGPTGNVDADQAGAEAFIDVELSTTKAYPGQEVDVAYFLYVRVDLEGAEAVTQPTFPGSVPHVLAGGGKLNFMRTTVGGMEYMVSPLQRYAIYPIAPGEVVADPFALNIAVRDRSSRRSRGDPFAGFFSRSVRKTVQSEPKAITVLPLPAEGRPANFPNNVGAYEMTARLDKTRVRAGEAVTLTLTVEGSGNSEALTLPQIPLAEGLKSFNQTSKDDSIASFDKMKSRRIFETIIVPEKEGDYVVGPIELPVFNPIKRAYENITAQPIALVVDPGDARTAQPKLLTKETVTLSGRDIRTIKADAARLRESAEPLRTRAVHWVAVFLAPMIFAARVYRVRRRERLASDTALARRTHAGREARKRLSAARKAAERTPAEFGAELREAVMGFIADHLNVEAPSLTAELAAARLAELGVPDGERATLTETLRTCDAMRYGGFAPDKAARLDMADAAARWIESVRGAFRNGGGR